MEIALGKSIYMSYHDDQQVLFVLLLRLSGSRYPTILCPSTFLNNLSNLSEYNMNCDIQNIIPKIIHAVPINIRTELLVRIVKNPIMYCSSKNFSYRE